MFANVGAGKTTFVGKKLPSLLDCEGFLIFLAPFNSLKQQTIESGLFDEEDDDSRKQLEGFTVFDSTVTPEELASLPNKKIAMTTQAFFWLVQKNPDVWDQVGALILDEVDHVLYSLPVWSNNPKDPFKRIVDTILEHIDDVYMIGLTATNQERLLAQWGNLANEILFEEEIREIKLDRKIGYSNLAQAFKTLPKGHGKVAVFIKQVKTASEYKDYFESLGHTVDLLVSENANAYEMNEHEKQLRQSIAESGDGDFKDIFIFNSTLERGVSLHNREFTHIFCHNSNEVTQAQVFGRFRYSGLVGYHLLPKEERPKAKVKAGLEEVVEYVIPTEYIDVPLTTVGKKQLAKDLDWSNPLNGRAVGWTTIKELLDPFYDIKEQTVRMDGKRVRVSVIEKKPNT